MKDDIQAITQPRRVIYTFKIPTLLFNKRNVRHFSIAG